MTEPSPQSWLTLPRILFWLLMLCFIGLQIRLWIGEGSLTNVWALEDAIERQQRNNHLAEERNKRLQAEVQSLKDGMDAVEERARAKLGMIKHDETFYLIIDEQSP